MLSGPCHWRHWWLLTVIICWWRRALEICRKTFVMSRTSWVQLRPARRCWTRKFWRCVRLMTSCRQILRSVFDVVFARLTHGMLLLLKRRLPIASVQPALPFAAAFIFFHICTLSPLYTLVFQVTNYMALSGQFTNSNPNHPKLNKLFSGLVSLPVYQISWNSTRNVSTYGVYKQTDQQMMVRIFYPVSVWWR